MHAKPAEIQEWPFIENVVVPIADWWRKRAAIRENLDKLGSFAPDELARMAKDVGIPRSDLPALVTHGSDAADLLDRRLQSLGLSATELAQRATAHLRDMQRLCTLCDSKGRCARGLAANPSDLSWQEYCPNRETLAALQHHGPHR
jgi:hypothetical protein